MIMRMLQLLLLLVVMMVVILIKIIDLIPLKIRFKNRSCPSRS